MEVPQVASPLRFGGQAPVDRDPPPLLGQHSEDILSSLGYGAADIRALREKGVI